MSGSLMGIHSRILQLMEQRQEIIESGVEHCAGLAPIEAQIIEEMQNEIRKVDGCAAYDRHLEREIRSYDEEIDRLKHEQSKVVAKRARYQDLLFGVMKRLGLTKLEGKLGAKLSIKQNPPAVQIDQPDLLPADYQRVKISMSLREYDILVLELRGQDSMLAIIKDVSDPTPVKADIASEIKAGGGVPGCSLIKGERLEIK